MAIIMIVLVGIAIVAAASLFLVQSASATTDAMNTTSLGRGEQEAVSGTSTTNTTNNDSNAVLGSLFMIVDFETASVNPINETDIEISTLNNVTIIPPNATHTTINATQTVNATLSILPKGLVIDHVQSLLVREGDDRTAEQEDATTTFLILVV